MLTVKQTLISIYKQLSIFSIDELTFPIKSCQYTDIFDAKFMIFSKICLHLATETKFKSRCYKIYGISKKILRIHISYTIKNITTETLRTLY